MEKNTKSFRDDVIELADIADKLESIELFENGKISITVELYEKEYRNILSNFREIDRNSDKFIIDISGVNYCFVLKM